MTLSAEHILTYDVLFSLRARQTHLSIPEPLCGSEDDCVCSDDPGSQTDPDKTMGYY